MSDRFICLGVVTGAIGVRGEVRVKTFTETPKTLANYGDLISEDGRAHFSVQAIREVKGGAGVRLEGIADRDAALALKGTLLGVDREALSEIDDEETFYHVDLIGLEVRNEEGQRLGAVKAVHDYGAGDVIEFTLDDNPKTELLPFRKETVPEVKIEDGYLTIAMPEMVEAREEEEGEGE